MIKAKRKSGYQDKSQQNISGRGYQEIRREASLFLGE
jgi:predicted DNA-binding WGR domain protein